MAGFCRQTWTTDRLDVLEHVLVIFYWVHRAGFTVLLAGANIQAAPGIASLFSGYGEARLMLRRGGSLRQVGNGQRSLRERGDARRRWDEPASNWFTVSLMSWHGVRWAARTMSSGSEL